MPQRLLASLQTVFGLLGLIWAVFRVFRRRNAAPQPHLDASPFEKIEPYSDTVVRRLLEHGTLTQTDDPLADYNIPYQQRVAERQIGQEIITCMEQADAVAQRWIVVLGRSGLGKSREAAQVAETLNREGWTVLRLKTLGWDLLSYPDRQVMESLGEQKLLFFLDDVNRMIPLEKGRVGTGHGHGVATLANVHPLDRLLKFLQGMEQNCRAKNVRVLATARNEPVPEKPGEPSELNKLGLDTLALWQRFNRYELPDPEVGALVELQRTGAEQADLKADPTQFLPIAQKSDRTMRVFVNNLRKAKRDNLPLEKVSDENLRDSWKNFYNRAKRQRVGTPYIYAAVFLLRALQVELSPRMVLPIARQMVSRGKLRGWGWLYYWQLQWALTFLTAIESTSILNPKDGQLEAAPIVVEPGEWVVPVFNQLLKLADRFPTEISVSLKGFGEAVYGMGRYVKALTSFRKTLELSQNQPNVDFVWLLRANCHYYLEQKEEAIASYDKALAVKPDYPEAWNNRGVALSDLGRKEEAIASYDKALAVEPDDHEVWNNHGYALSDVGRQEEAIASFDKALEFKPDYHEAWNNRGVAFLALGHQEEAIASFDKALAVKPDYYQACYNRSLVLSDLGRKEEAIISYDKALAVKSDYHEAWFNRGLVLSGLGRKEEAIASYDKALAVKPDYDDAWINRGNALSALGRKEEAIASYDQALAVKPSLHEAWYNRGLALSALGQREKAIASYDKALAVKPSLHEAWYNKACCYALWGKLDEALENLQRSIQLDAKYREMAKTNTAFDGIREDERFRLLLEGDGG